MLTVSAIKQLSHFQLDIEFQVKDEIVVLFGPSGSGKTTILNIIAGIIHPDSGSIKLNDIIYYDDNTKPLPIQKRNIGYLFQDYALFPHMTVEKNILYGVKEKGITMDSPVSKLLDVMGIGHLLAKYPNQISGGEKQRVALARALATEPGLLLLDEPFSALDEQTRMECHEELIRLHRIWRIPVILVTHNLEEANKIGKRILHINEGKLTKPPGIKKTVNNVNLSVI